MFINTHVGNEIRETASCIIIVREMASTYQTLKDLDLTRDEVERFGNALKDKEFRKLFAEYVEEIQDPENRKLYQKEIAELEKERGVDVTFINPVAGYVIKTSVDGNKKCFINICSNEHIKKPISTPTLQEGAKGLQWSIPHSVTPVREDFDNKKIRCDVYDVVFHADTLHLAQNNKAFRDMVNNTACEAIESNFDVKLDKKNLKFPKMQYKGVPQATVIRKPSKDKTVEHSAEEQQLLDRLYASVPAQQPKSPKKKKSNKKVDDFYSAYTRPNYIIKHRSHVDMQEFTENKDAKINAAIPKELIVEVDLPLLKSSSDITLDVNEKTLHLISEKPSKYKLELTLPYQVNQDSGNAKFDKDLKKLVVTLPVKRSNYTSYYDSGVESDHGSPISGSPAIEESPISDCEIRTNSVKFLDENVHYSLPDYSCHIFENTIAFTLNVKNVSENSIEKIVDEAGSSIHVKFASISSGFFPNHYAFYVKLPSHFIDTDDVTVEAWDNNVIMQFPFKPTDEIIKSYYIGLNEDDLTLKYVEEPCILNDVLKQDEDQEKPLDNHKKDDSKIPAEETEIKNNSPQKQPSTDINSDEERKKTESKAIDIINTYSESSGDELSCSFSPSKKGGILKRLGRRNVSRSISESSLDDMYCASSFDNCHTSLDSMIPEDGEMSTSLKKTVRFNDHVSKQLYR